LIPGLAPRAAAWRVLHDLRHEVPLDRALQRNLGGLGDADRALAHEIAAGVLRHRAPLDQALAPFLAGGTAKVRDDVLDILRLGAYQLLHLDRVPPHAAVDTAVTLARRFGGAGVGGFVNAVLRRVATSRIANRESGVGIRVSGSNIQLPKPDTRHPTPDGLAAEYSHPEWLVARWLPRFGAEETERLLRANNRRPELVIQPARWNEDAIIASLDAAGIRWQHAPFSAGLVIVGRRPQELPGFGAGAWFVQDPAQALVIRFAGVPAGATLLDAAAAPGGKALGLSRSTGFLVAADLRRSRIRRLRENLTRAGSGAFAVIAADAEHPAIRSCDIVLLDAPCLGTGSFARHPDARWRVNPEALATVAQRSGRMLRSLATVVGPGGMLVFATCSLEPEENELQVEAFLAANRRFRRERPPADLLPGDLLTEAGDLVLLPHRHGTDGAYAARLRRIS
jgi:16S rRNA (cytosine967-C5)-methyltransferase